MDVHVFDDQQSLKLPHAVVQAIANQVVSNEGHQYDEVSIHFVDKDNISELHKQYFDDPTPTDCISFPMDDADAVGYRVLGEVFVCPQTAIEYAKAHGMNPYDETALYIVHGLLHLLGYDDMDEQDESAMRAAEARHLANLKKQGISLR